jgi:hypothetical protein
VVVFVKCRRSIELEAWRGVTGISLLQAWENFKLVGKGVKVVFHTADCDINSELLQHIMQI